MWDGWWKNAEALLLMSYVNIDSYWDRSCVYHRFYRQLEAPRQWPYWNAGRRTLCAFWCFFQGWIKADMQLHQQRRQATCHNPWKCQTPQRKIMNACLTCPKKHAPCRCTEVSYFNRLGALHMPCFAYQRPTRSVDYQNLSWNGNILFVLLMLFIAARVKYLWVVLFSVIAINQP